MILAVVSVKRLGRMYLKVANSSRRSDLAIDFKFKSIACFQFLLKMGKWETNPLMQVKSGSFLPVSDKT